MKAFNSIISFLAEIGMLLCLIIAVFMVNTKLGIVFLGLYAIQHVAEFMIRRENKAAMKRLFHHAEKL